MPVSVDASPTAAPRVRVLTPAATAVAAVAAAVLYVPVVAGLARQWSDDADAAYGAIVAVASALAFWQRLPALRGQPLAGAPVGLVPLLAAALLYVAGTLAADVFLLRLSLPVFAAAALWFVAGARHLRVLAAPLALSVVAIPPPSALVTEITMPLQLVASQVAASMLWTVGVPVVRDGNVLTLSYITLEVAQACSGMRSLVTLAALVAVYAAVRGLPIGRVAILAMLTVPVALAGNALRVAGTALLAARLGADATRGVVHEATGWVAFVAMCGGLLALHATFSADRRPSSLPLEAGRT